MLCMQKAHLGHNGLRADVTSTLSNTPCVDVTSGITTRAKLKRHDPRLASLLAAAYGDGPWRYPQTAPAPFAAHGGRSVWLASLCGSLEALARHTQLDRAIAVGSRRKQQQLRGRTQRFSIRRLFSCCLPSPRQYSKVS
jgi:hypothetical protein